MKKRIIENCSGSSIVSVMAAFVILMISIAMISTATIAALKITNRSLRVRLDVEAAMQDYYLTPGAGTDTTREEKEKIFTLQVKNDSGHSVQFTGMQGTFKKEFEEEGEKRTFELYYFKLPEDSTETGD